MPKRKRPTRTAAEDRAAFIAAAHELGCDESPEAFADTIKKLSTVKPISYAQLKKGRKKK